MKKIFNILLAGVIACGIFTACSDYEAPEVSNDTAVKVLSRETSFPAGPSQGTIVIESESPVTAIPGSDWMSAEVSGNTVTVSVDQNPSFDGRSAMLTLKNSLGTTQIAIIQSGIIISFGDLVNINTNDDAQTLTYPIKANCPLVLESDNEWIDAKVVNNELVVNLSANTTGHVRNGSIKYGLNAADNVIQVTQLDFAKDIAGNYMFVYYNSSDRKWYYFDAVLGNTGSNYAIDLPDVGVSIPVLFNTSTYKLTLNAGVLLGQFDAGYLYTVVWDTNAGYLTWGTGIGMDASFIYDEEEATTIAEFEDNDTWGSYKATALRLEWFSGTPASSSTRLNSLWISMIYPYLMKVDATAASAKSAASMEKSSLTIAQTY